MNRRGRALALMAAAATTLAACGGTTRESASPGSDSGFGANRRADNRPPAFCKFEEDVAALISGRAITDPSYAESGLAERAPKVFAEATEVAPKAIASDLAEVIEVGQKLSVELGKVGGDIANLPPEAIALVTSRAYQNHVNDILDWFEQRC